MLCTARKDTCREVKFEIAQTDREKLKQLFKNKKSKIT